MSTSQLISHFFAHKLPVFLTNDGFRTYSSQNIRNRYFGSVTKAIVKMFGCQNSSIFFFKHVDNERNLIIIKVYFAINIQFPWKNIQKATNTWEGVGERLLDHLYTSSVIQYDFKYSDTFNVCNPNPSCFLFWNHLSFHDLTETSSPPSPLH